ncbi:MAG: 23S rRNA (pseudouridine(1915)-N(3))-methyltransferase RlmH [Paludibacter sp.]|nr:23S rRNA (pseudouridine(1915)-N(3))-methyltransferase RlmH [Paludibacter sp.]
MKVLLLMIGKTNQESLQQLILDYTNRIQYYLNFETVVIPELKNTRNLSTAEQKEKEADMILKQIDNQDNIILLDEKGKQYSSLAFADFMEKKMNSSIKRMVFVVGGPFGFSKKIYDRANGMISMSPMTFSHQMIRLIFTEQLYRAMTIIRGENYHHE